LPFLAKPQECAIIRVNDRITDETDHTELDGIEHTGDGSYVEGV
jgi:hypothetical protein